MYSANRVLLLASLHYQVHVEVDNLQKNSKEARKRKRERKREGEGEGGGWVPHGRYLLHLIIEPV